MGNNIVELIGYYGDDEIIACSAWTSTSRKLTEKKRNRIPQLLNMLWREGHHTPFEKATFHFLVDTDIASHIHLLKHRIASINAESARYKELKEDKFYVPSDWNNKWQDKLTEFNEYSNKLYHSCIEELGPEIGRKRAKESARFFKPYASQIQADVMFNFRSFANMVQLRASEHAQVEIREIAQQMVTLVKGIDGNPFKHTLEACKWTD